MFELADATLCMEAYDTAARRFTTKTGHSTVTVRRTPGVAGWPGGFEGNTASRNQCTFSLDQLWKHWTFLTFGTLQH